MFQEVLFYLQVTLVLGKREWEKVKEKEGVREEKNVSFNEAPLLQL